MPYGLPKEIDTPENNAKIDECVKNVMSKGKDKDSAISICKAQVMANKEKKDKMADDRFYFSLSNSIGKSDKWQEIIREGDWSNSYKQFKITKAHLDDFVNNFQNNVLNIDGGELQVNFSHDSDKEAAGWIYDLEVSKNDKEKWALFAKIRWTPIGRKKIESEEFKFFSAEIDFKYKDQENGATTKNVLLGAALTNIPFVSGMKAVSLSDVKNADSINFNKFLTKNMETFKVLMSSLEAKEIISSSEFDLLKLAMTSLSDDEKAEVEKKVEEISTKVEEKEEKNLTQKLSKTEIELETYKKLSSDLKSKVDKLERDQRISDETSRVEKLCKAGKLLPKDLERTVKLLTNKSQKDADEIFEILSAQPASIDFTEKGVTGDFNEDTQTLSALDDQATQLIKNGDTRPKYQILSDLIRKSSPIQE